VTKDDFALDDEFDVYEELFNPLYTDRKARRARKPKAKHQPKKSHRQIITDLADATVGLEGGFTITYQPSRYEGPWLLASLRSFYDLGLIHDVMNLIKGGKEASVYRCQAEPTIGLTWLAAKVYRPHQFRTLRNDRMYREGRGILDARGNDHDHARDQRVARAVGKKTAFGRQVAHTSWLMHEYTALECLHQAGAAVPKPIAASDNAVLMSYHGDARMAAPTLNRVSLEPDEAVPLFQEVLRNVELMLWHDLIHGDLSAYNILYWEGELTVIDFPQVTNIRANSNAYAILRRDIERICEYFGRQGVQCDSAVIVDELWRRYGEVDPPIQAADESRLMMAWSDATI
jgi:RIO kinase 1